MESSRPAAGRRSSFLELTIDAFQEGLTSRMSNLLVTKDSSQASRIARRREILPVASGGAAQPPSARRGGSSRLHSLARPGSRPPSAGAEAPDRAARTTGNIFLCRAMRYSCVLLPVACSL
eukprot:GHVT01036194.1.p1 GENE.GHVT01036194.1~~GHVT01036194.1.p1  ORF type:complete len:121 (-),score=11.86 GHVT01036194.1:53-415(-)